MRFFMIFIIRNLLSMKCVFMVTPVNFLCLLVSKDGFSEDYIKIQEIVDWTHPETLRKLQSFLGLTSFFSYFITTFSDVAAPLKNLAKNKSFDLFGLDIKAFTHLK